MIRSSSMTSGRELGDYVEAFEEAHVRGGAVELADFLPDREDPLYFPVLVELVCVDLYRGWKNGSPQPLEDYQDRFPEVFADPKHLKAIVFEEYRLRRWLGQQPSPADYQRRFGVDVTDGPESLRKEVLGATWDKDTVAWSECLANESPVGQVSNLPEIDGQVQAGNLPHNFSADLPLGPVARAFREWLMNNSGSDDEALDGWCSSWGGSAEQAHLFRDLYRSNPEAACRLSRALANLPEVGSEIMGFRLIEELGRGAFGKVFLAQQRELANRRVALKIATDLLGESQTLAQLQHTHIVPIYSIHRAAPFQAVCMPYYGRTTLADVLSNLVEQKALPASGTNLVTTLRNRRAPTLVSSAESEAEEAQAALLAAEAPAPEPVWPGRRRDTLAMLQRMTYVQSILWLAARLTDGLAHAHDRGILHRDLKPANVLLTDEGQPMLLDFNLSADTKLRGSAAAAFVGGTLPYMAPENLQAFRDSQPSADARSDLYSFGIILYELLSGRAAFPQRRSGKMTGVLDRMIADRRQPPRLRCWNRAVSPAVESIVRHCLAPDPSRRYQTAHELREDLQRQLDNRPLRYAPDPSLRERLQKWARRHPRLTSRTTIGAAILTFVLTLATVLGYQAQRSTRIGQAQEAYRQTQEDMRTARFLLNAHSADRRKQRLGIASGRRIIDRYQVLQTASWKSLPAIGYLSTDEQGRLREDLGEVLWLLARTSLNDAGGKQEIALALRMNELAETCYPDGQVPPTLWTQRAELGRRLGRAEEARRGETMARRTPERTARDHYLRASELLVLGRLHEALPHLREATRQGPQHFWSWFLRGLCHDQLGQAADARASYTACAALWPEYPWSYFNRGLVYLRQKEYARARADLDQAIQLQPDQADMYLNRALALQGLGRPAEAIADLGRALAKGASPGWVYLQRARIRDQAGDADDARRDRAKGLHQLPVTEQDWIARGIARLNDDPNAALADFRRALELNPRSLAALQNQAHVLAERPDGQDDAIRILDRTLALYPDYVPARSGRGVLLARMGKRREALRDAEEALRRDMSPRILYQVAGIYALTSRQKPEDRQEAFRLLSAALRRGFGFELLEKDRDLDPLRDQPQFRRLTEMARDLKDTPAVSRTR